MKPLDAKYVKQKKKGIKLFTRKIGLWLMFCFSGFSGLAQDAIFSQFYANPLYLNPALTGAGQCTRLNMNYRNQPFPEFGTFSTYSVSADTYFERLSGGLGVMVLHDNQGGLVRHNRVGFSYAYHGRLSQSWFVNMGMQALYLNYHLASANLTFADQYDPFTGNTNSTSSESLDGLQDIHAPDFAAGILIYNEAFFAGASLSQLAQSPSGFFGNEKSHLKYTFHMGYKYSPAGYRSAHATTDPLSLSPNLIIQAQNGFIRFNYGFYANISPLITGVWFRHNLDHPNSLIFTLGLKQVNYSVSYSYDYSFSGFSPTLGGAHEIGVLLNFNCTDRNMKYRILNCPTF